MKTWSYKAITENAEKEIRTLMETYPPQGIEVKPYLCPKCNGQKKVQTPLG
jgi:hypothetical protein